MTRKVVFSGMVPLRRTRGLVVVAVVVAVRVAGLN